MAQVASRDNEATPGLAIDAMPIGHRLVVGVAGELDIATADTLRSALESHLGSAVGELWIDLTALTFMDSNGLRAVLGANRALRTARKRFAVICPDGPVRRVFALAGVEDVIDIYTDRAAANHA